jgi:uncharacterized protein (TIGR02598 family)
MISRIHASEHKRQSLFAAIQRGFSLVEVVVAVGIFALAIVGVIGLLAPTSKNIVDVADSDAASRVISSIQSQLQASGYDSVKTNLGATFYATKTGDTVGPASVFSSAGLKDQDKFFEFTLVRNDTLSPAGNDSTAGYLAFTIVLKWPAYAASANGIGTPVDASQKSTMIVPAAVTR